MCKVTASARFNGHELTDMPVLNPGDWFGKCFLLEIGGSYTPLFLVVEAGSVQDAIDELAEDEQYGHLITVPDEDLGDYDPEDCHYGPNGQVLDLDWLMVHGQEGVDWNNPTNDNPSCRSYVMDNTIRSLIARVWKKEALDLNAGEHYFDEILTLHVSGTVTKQTDQMAAPTTSLPLIPILALFWEKCGVSRDHALRMLREAITEAMENGKNKDERIEARIKDVEKALETVKKDLIGKLPKVKRSGRVVTKDLQIEVLPVDEEALSPAAA